MNTLAKSNSILSRLLMLCLSLMATICVNAQSEIIHHWMIGFTGGFNNDGYEADLNFSWWPVKSFGVKIAIGMAGEFEKVSDWDWLYDDDYYEDEYDYAERFKFMPSLELVSPALVKNEDSNFSLHLFASPGLCLSPGASGSHNADWFYWQLRTGLQANFGEIILQLGYGYSNFNLFSGDPYYYHEHSLNPNRHTSSGFLTIGYKI